MYIIVNNIKFSSRCEVLLET